MLVTTFRRWLGAGALISMLILSACGDTATAVPATSTAAPAAAATPTTAAMTAATPTTAASGTTPAAGATGTAAPAAPTNTAVVVGDPNAKLLINGAGATFPAPIYIKWFQTYIGVDPTVRFNYQPIGSGAGIQQIQSQTVDFGASDAPLSDDQLSKAKGGALYHIPTVAGAIVVAYNLPGVDKGLKLDGDTLAKIYLGTITRWNDPAITGPNPDLASKLTGDIAVVHRSDGSGTSYHFTDYLSAVSANWKSKVGKGTAVNWPVGLGGRGNAGVAGLVQQTPGGIGYIELAYALQNKIPYAFMKNAAGEYVEPTLDATRKAAESLTNIPDDMRVAIVNVSGAGVYPIAGYTYILVYQKQTDAAKGTGVAKFLWWAIHDGEAQAESLSYSPLAPAMVKLAEAKIKAMDCGGSPCYK